MFGYDKVGNYLIKNSWGKSWGTNGFATINVNKDCGITKIVLQYQDGANTTVLKSGTCNVYQSAYGNDKSEWRMLALLQFAVIITLAMAF